MRSPSRVNISIDPSDMHKIMIPGIALGKTLSGKILAMRATCPRDRIFDAWKYGYDISRDLEAIARVRGLPKHVDVNNPCYFI
ncbi:MAG: hypothetical protein QXQ17_02565 [Desulfurococcaceae archaeon]